MERNTQVTAYSPIDPQSLDDTMVLGTVTAKNGHCTVRLTDGDFVGIVARRTRPLRVNLISLNTVLANSSNRRVSSSSEALSKLARWALLLLFAWRGDPVGFVDPELAEERLWFYWKNPRI